MVSTVNDVRARAERLLLEPVRLADLALAFDETVASAVDVHVEGRRFFPQAKALGERVRELTDTDSTLVRSLVLDLAGANSVD